MQVEEIVLVWKADAGVRGHVGYAVQKLLGNEECVLCELTHGAVAERSEWKSYKRDLGVPFSSVYRNRLSSDQARVVGGEFPCVLARTSAGLVKILGPEAIDACEGDLGALTERLRAAIDGVPAGNIGA